MQIKKCKRCSIILADIKARKYCPECAKKSNRESQKKSKEKYIERHRVWHITYDKKRYETKGATPKDEAKTKVRNHSNNHFKKDTKCHFCKSEERLQFHHIKYEYPSKKEYLKTVCGSCHRKLHFLMKPIQARVGELEKKVSDYNTKFLHQDRIIDELEKELEDERR